MPSFRRVALACALFTLCSFAHAGGASTLDVLSLTDSPDPLVTGQTSTMSAEVRYFAVGHDVGTPLISIDHLVRVKTTVVNPAGTTIRTLASEFSAERPAGQLPGLRTKSVSMLWDGKDAEGAAVPADTYTYRVQAQRLIRFTFSLCGQFRVEDVVIHQSSTKQGTITVSGVQDETPPLIADFAPANGAWTTQTRPPLSASFSDVSSGVDPGSVEVLLDGLPVTVVASADGFTFTPSADLAQGSHTVSISVSDLAGNASNAAWTFSVDTLPPGITELAPSHGAFLRDTRPLISASFYDGEVGIGVNVTSVFLTLDGEDVTTEATISPMGIHFSPAEDLNQGSHALLLSVADLIGNSVTTSATFKVDTLQPLITDHVPPDSGIVRDELPTIWGRLFDLVTGIDATAFKLYLDGELITTVLDATGFFFAHPNLLDDGEHSVTVNFRDQAGNSGTHTWRFTVETLSPIIENLAVSPSGVTNNPRPTFSAEFIVPGSSDGLDPSRVLLLLDGLSVTEEAVVTASGFSYTPAETLSDGLHELRILITSGNPVEASVAIEVDSTPPVLNGVGDVTVEAVVPEGNDVFFTSIAAQDASSGVQTLEFDPENGSTFPLGISSVTATATDGAGNISTSVFSVEVVDTTPPTIKLLPNIQVIAAGPEGSVVVYEPAVAEDAASTPTISYSHPSGSTFPAGQTTVTATATDAAGLQATTTFVVTVQLPVRVEVSPAEVTIPRNGVQQFTAIVYDEFDQPVVPQSPVIWSVDGGTGAISEAGLYFTDQAPSDLVGVRAGGIGGGDDEGVGTFIVQAQAGILTATASVTVQPSVFTVEFLRPELPREFMSPANIEIEASVFSDPSPVVLVEFIVFNTTTGETQKIGEVTEAPYTVAWPKVLPGRYNIQARAINEEGAAQSSILSLDVYYNLIEIGLPGAGSSEAWGLNMHRQVVGVSRFLGIPRAFLWDGPQEGLVVDLGIGEARAINDSGQIVGQSEFLGDSPLLHATLWISGLKTDLHPVVGPYRTGLAHAVNSMGKSVGIQDYGDAFGTILPVGASLWQGAGTESLWHGSPVPEARGINDLGQVVGWKEVEHHRQAVLWEQGNLTYLTFGEGNGRERGAYAINNSGAVVGECDGFAALWRKATPTQWMKINLQGDLVFDEGEFKHYGGVGTGGRAYAINGCGEIVGYVDDANRADESKQRWAALWTENGSARELNELIHQDSGWWLEEARGINANGDIVGVGKKDGQIRAFLLSTGLVSDGEGTRDNTPPTIVQPLDIVVLAEDETGAIVTFPEPTVLDDQTESDNLFVSVTPPSGTKFPIGKTTVQIAARDGCGNLQSTSFNVVVFSVLPKVLVAGLRQVVKIQGWFEVNPDDMVNVSFTPSIDGNGQVLIVPIDAEGQPLPGMEPAELGAGRAVASPTAAAQSNAVEVLVEPTHATRGFFSIQAGEHIFQNVVNVENRIVWLDGTDKIREVGRTSRLATPANSTQMVRPFRLSLGESENGDQVTISLERGGVALRTREYTVVDHVLTDSSGSNPRFVFVESPASNIYDASIPGFGSAVIVEVSQGDCLAATRNGLVEGIAPLWIYDPHEPGDYSVDALGGDVQKTGGTWTATKYYYSIDAQRSPYPLPLDDTQAEFHADVNYLWNLNGGANESAFDADLSGLIDINIGVDRFIQSGGVIVPKHIANGIVSQQVRIRACTTGAVSVSLNGVAATQAGGASLSSDAPSVIEFTVGSTALKTALLRGTNGSRPNPAANILRFSGQDYSIHWVELSFDAISPYVLVHGKGADGHFWRAAPPSDHSKVCWPPFVDDLKRKEIPHDDTISLQGTLSVPSQDTVENQSDDLNGQIVPIVSGFGTRHTNLIVHSKGGLDSRYWLTEVNPDTFNRGGRKLVVGQYITICTPHRGSVIADYAILPEFITIADIDANVAAGNISVDTSGFLHIFRAIAAATNNDTPATYCLRTNRFTGDQRTGASRPPLPDDTATYNQVFGGKLPTYRNVDTSQPTFWALKADADRNFDKQITLNQDLTEAVAYDPAATAGHIAYSALGRNKSIFLPGTVVGIDTPGIGETVYPLGVFMPNDLLVTHESAIFAPFQDFLGDSLTHYDHGAICRDFIANQLFVRQEVMTPRK